MDMLDATGKVVPIPDDQVQAAFQSGAYRLKPGARIPIQRGTGEIGSVSPEGLKAELAADGQVISQEQYDRAQAQAQYGGLGGMAQAAVAGALRGATVGLSDPVITAVAGDEARQRLQGLQRANPVISGGSELAGAALPAILSGGETAPAEAGMLGREALAGGTALADMSEAAAAGNAVDQATVASKVARGAYDTVTLPTRAVADVGKGVEHIIGAAIGDNSPGLMARTVQRAVAKGGSGALEGALYGMGNQISEDVLGDKQLTAEQLYAAAGHGAIFGGLLGGGLAVTGELGGAAFTKLARSEAAQKLNEELGWRALNARGPLTKEADRYVAGGHRGVARQLLEDGVYEAGDTVEDLQPKIESGYRKAVDAENKFIQEADSSGARGVNLKSIIGDIRSGMPNVLAKMGDEASEFRAVENEIAKLTRLANDDGHIKIGDALELRKYLDDHINYQSALTYKMADSPLTREMKRVRAVVDGHISQAIDEAKMSWVTDPLYGEGAKAYKAMKEVTQKYIIARKAVTNAVAALNQNNYHSLTDKMAGMTGMMLGAGRAMAHGAGPLGSASNMALGILAGQASKMVRERGAATLAAVMHKAADLAAVRKVTQRLEVRASKEIGKAVAGAAYKGKPLNLDEFDEKARLVRLAKQASNHEMAVNNHLGSLTETAPETSGNFGSVSRRVTMMLASKLPQEAYHPLGGHPEPSSSEKADFLRAYRAADDPVGVLFRDIRSGTLTNDTVQTIKKVLPTYWAQIQHLAAQQIREDKTMPYTRKLALSRALELDLDGTTNAQFVMAQQAYWAASSAKKQHATGSRAGHPRKAALSTKGLSTNMTLSSRTTGLGLT